VSCVCVRVNQEKVGAVEENPDGNNIIMGKKQHKPFKGTSVVYFSRLLQSSTSVVIVSEVRKKRCGNGRCQRTNGVNEWQNASKKTRESIEQKKYEHKQHKQQKQQSSNKTMVWDSKGT